MLLLRGCLRAHPGAAKEKNGVPLPVGRGNIKMLHQDADRGVVAASRWPNIRHCRGGAGGT
jgi:hypothetical protein